MIKLLDGVPSGKLGLALSGGIDSMTFAHFLLQGRHEFAAFYFNHGTKHGDLAEEFVREWCGKNEVDLVTSHINDSDESKSAFGSVQEWYRKHRYQFFKRFGEYEIITCHHLDDVLETWLFSTFHGKAKLIPYRHANCIRPFLLTTKKNIRQYAINHEVPWIEDESNASVEYMRNHIRHNIVPEVEIVNPGIRKHIDKLILNMYSKYKVTSAES